MHVASLIPIILYDICHEAIAYTTIELFSVILMWQYNYRIGESVPPLVVGRRCLTSLGTSIVEGMLLASKLKAIAVSLNPFYLVFEHNVIYKNMRYIENMKYMCNILYICHTYLSYTMIILK